MNRMSPKRISSTSKPDKCPRCGAPVYKILYGEPAMSVEDYFRTSGEHVVFGGCIISGDDPMWACSRCGTEIYQR